MILRLKKRSWSNVWVAMTGFTKDVWEVCPVRVRSSFVLCVLTSTILLIVSFSTFRVSSHPWFWHTTRIELLDQSKYRRVPDGKSSTSSSESPEHAPKRRRLMSASHVYVLLPGWRESLCKCEKVRLRIRWLSFCWFKLKTYPVVYYWLRESTMDTRSWGVGNSSVRWWRPVFLYGCLYEAIESDKSNYSNRCRYKTKSIPKLHERILWSYEWK